jgi:hypothetical protein
VADSSYCKGKARSHGPVSKNAAFAEFGLNLDFGEIGAVRHLPVFETALVTSSVASGSARLG